MHFSLVKLRPNALPHSMFDDAILPLYFALKQLGFDVEMLINKVNKQSRNIIFDSCFVPKDIGNCIPKNSIIYNFEQMTPNGFSFFQDYLDHLRDFEVWDYNEINTQELKKKNINVTYLPVGYVPEMSRLNRNIAPETDLLFYGNIKDCRKRAIESIRESGIHLVVGTGVYGNRRDELICQTKAVLNIHSYYTPARLEEIRMGYLWANKVPILSEIRYNTCMPKHLEEACLYASYDRLAEQAKSFVTDKKRLEAQGNLGFMAFSSQPFVNSLKLVLGKKLYAMGSNNSIREIEPIKIGLLALHTNPFLRWLHKQMYRLKNSLRKKVIKIKHFSFNTITARVPLMERSLYTQQNPQNWVIKKDIR